MLSNKERIASCVCVAFALLMFLEAVIFSNPNYERIKSMGSCLLFLSLACCPRYLFIRVSEGLTQDITTIIIKSKMLKVLLNISVCLIFTGYFWQFVI